MKHAQEYVRQQASGRLLQRRGRWRQGRIGLDSSAFASVAGNKEEERDAVSTHHQDANIELLSHAGQPAQKLVELLLPIGQLSAPAVVDAETRHDAVDDEKTEFIGREGGGESVQ